MKKLYYTQQTEDYLKKIKVIYTKRYYKHIKNYF